MNNKETLETLRALIDLMRMASDTDENKIKIELMEAMYDIAEVVVRAGDKKDFKAVMTNMEIEKMLSGYGDLLTIVLKSV